MRTRHATHFPSHTLAPHTRRFVFFPHGGQEKGRKRIPLHRLIQYLSRVLLAGFGLFQNSFVLPGGSAPTELDAAADMDGDGHLDVLLGNYGTPSRVLLNAGDGTFQISVELRTAHAITRALASGCRLGTGRRCDRGLVLASKAATAIVKAPIDRL